MTATAQVGWHALDVAAAAQRAETDLEQGLTAGEVSERLARYGANTLAEPPPRRWWRRAFDQVSNPLIVVLLVAAAVTLALRDYVDSAVILAVVVINALIGYVQEGKAESALSAVRAMVPPRAVVVRDGTREELPSTQIVPGDLVLLSPGDRVPADLRLIRATDLSIDESTLTGESVAVTKSVAPVEQGVPLADRTCLAYSGTLVVRGHARGTVIATGDQTEVGRIGVLVASEANLTTPLTRRLNRLTWQTTGVILLLGALAFGYSVLFTGLEALAAFLAVVAMVVAAIPEGLPAIITIVLAIGARAMARQHAVIRRLPAVETLGSVSLIFTDKTGTLTCNEMTVVGITLPGSGPGAGRPGSTIDVSGVGYTPVGEFTCEGRSLDPARREDLAEILTAGQLCNDSALRELSDGEWTVVGDPMEGALTAVARKASIEPGSSAERFPRVDEVPFHADNRYMITVHETHGGGSLVVVKGAPEKVLPMCDGLDMQAWARQVREAAAKGQRVLAIATARSPHNRPHLAELEASRRFRLLGTVGLIDPARPEAIEAVRQCRAAGIEVKMITGDHVGTAQAVGRELGLSGRSALTGAELDGLSDDAVVRAVRGTDVIARASPAHKLQLTRAFQASGSYVAMTGDGVNDAPALRGADIGIAMGRRGSDAARDSAELVLADDNFATVAAAVERGRLVYDNVKKALLFVLPTSGGQAALILFALMFAIALPVTVGQILWVNMVTAVTLALALAFEPAESGLMRQPPRPARENLITGPVGARIVFVSLLMVAATLAGFGWELSRGSSLAVAQTTAVNVLVFSELLYLFNVRHFTASSLNRETFTGNRIALWVSGILVILQVVFTYAPWMQQIFGTAALGWSSWLVVVALASAKFLAVETEKAWWRRTGRHRL